ncbi:hypothetical protein [Arabiibacter massiliensis]|nr:hypothetical protein [Arabiibacter massiliensis]
MEKHLHISFSFALVFSDHAVKNEICIEPSSRKTLFDRLKTVFLEMRLR